MIYKFPDVSTVNPWGALNWAAVPCPFTTPILPLPANVVTKPVFDIALILLLEESPTYTVPELNTATPVGLLNFATVPWPSR